MKKITLIFALFTLSFSIAKAQCIFTIAGQGYGGMVSDSIPATAANIDYCSGVAVDSLGYVYVSVAQNDLVEKISPSGLMTYVAGTGSVGLVQDGVPATTSPISSPRGIVVDPKGNIYFADLGDNRIRKVNAAGIISTVAGTGNTTYNGDGIAATAANINEPYGVAVDDSGNVYIAEYGNQRIRKVSVVTGKIFTLAGNGTAGSTGDGGLATAAEVNYPFDVKTDGNYNVYFSENAGQRIRLILHATRKMSTIGGNGTPGSSGNGGAATAAEINAPEGIAVDKAGNVFIADYNNNQVREIAISAKMSLIAGTGTGSYAGDYGPATAAYLNNPASVAVDKNGNIFIADLSNSRIREVSSSGPTTPINTTPIANLTICFGGSTKLSVSDASLGVLAWYNSSSGGSHIGSTDTMVTGPLYGNTTFYAEDSTGCGISSRVAISVTVNPTPSVALTSKHQVCTGCGYTTICNGVTDTLIATASNGTPPYTQYNWMGSVGITTSSKQAVSPTSNAFYTVQVTDANGCLSPIPTSSFVTTPDTLEEKVLPASVTIAGSYTLACGNQVVLSPTYNPSTTSTITWSPATYLSSASVKNPTCTPGSPTTYTVVAKFTNGCTASATTSVVDTFASNISICTVTVDTSSSHNIIVWDKTGMHHIDSFKVYYMNSSSTWQLVKSVPFSAPSYIVDSTPINNPNANTVRYCLTAVDSCGNEEHFSSSTWQNTAFMIGNGSGTFSWAGTAYLVEGIPNPVKTYVLQRDTLSDGHWQGIDSVSGTQTQMTDPNYSKYPFSRYRVNAELLNSCPTPDLRPEAANSSTSRSNTQHNTIFTGIKPVSAADAISVYPNPANENLNIKFSYAKATTADIKVYDVTGRVLSESQYEVTPGATMQMNIASLPSGVYFVKVSTANSSLMQKFVKE